MAVINDPTIAALVARIGMGAGMVWTPMHVVSGPLPVGSGGAFSLSMQSATMSASLGANSEIFQFRYVTGAARLCLVHGITFSASVVTLPPVSTTVLSGPLSVRAAIAREWTAKGSSGTRATITGNSNKLRVGHATTEVDDAGISSSAALTAGTKTIDANDIASAVLTPPGILTAVGIGAPMLCPRTALFGAFAQGLQHPIILGHEEGIILRSGLVFPGTMTWSFTVDIAWSEVDSF